MCFKKKPTGEFIGADTLADMSRPYTKYVWYFDGQYNFMSYAEWAEYIPKACAKFNKYVPEYRDCDDFALALKVVLSQEKTINGIGICLGNSPGGYHAWNAILTPNIYFVEPQTGEIFNPGENGYEAEWIIW